MKLLLTPLTLILSALMPLLAWGAAPDDNEYIQVDWYPLLTDSVGWNITSGGLAFGMVNAVGSQAPDVAMAGSFELSWINVIGAKYNNGKGQRLTIGLGIDWKNYKLKHGHCFTRNENEVMTVGDYPQDATGCYSRIKVFSLGVPVIFRQRIGKSTDLFLGEITNFNLHAGMYTRYQLNGEKVTLKSSNIHQVPVSIDLIAGATYKKIGFYFRYNPFKVLKSGYGPQFSTIATGIVLGL